MNEKRIPKLVIAPSELDCKYNLMKDFVNCPYCNSNLLYIKITWGIVVEENEYGVMWNKSNRTYEIRETGFSLHCAECGDFIEHYIKFYPEDRIIYEFEKDLSWDDYERNEVDYCLHQFNQKRDFTPNYKFGELNLMKDKLLEYEKKYPEVVDEKK